MLVPPSLGEEARIWYLLQDSQDSQYFSTQPSLLAPTSPTSSTKPDESSIPGEPLPLSALSLVKAANEALNLSKVWPLSRILGPTSLHQQN